MDIGMVTLSARRRAGSGKTEIACRESIRHRTRVVQDVGTGECVVHSCLSQCAGPVHRTLASRSPFFKSQSKSGMYD
ncbi:hypothetical protein K439DRAFT_1000878 [Ramaria rubella]|nr:hypothetical protein K439DRAFT_1000878 [Ramaria rubella]